MTQPERRIEIRKTVREIISVALAEDLAAAHQLAAVIATDPDDARTGLVEAASAAVVCLAGIAATSSLTPEQAWQVLSVEIAAADDQPPTTT